MNNECIIGKLLQNLLEASLWFTTKNDPTFNEPSSYYELDEYGDLTPSAQSKVVKEIEDFVGDGAVDIEDAIDLWIRDNAEACKIGYKDDLVTNFKAKPVVDQIDAFTNLNEAYTATMLADRLDSPNIMNNDRVMQGMSTAISTGLLEPTTMKQWTKKDWQRYYNDFAEACHQSIANGGLNKINIHNLQIQAKTLGVEDVQFTEETIEDDIDKLATAYANKKENQYEAIYNKFMFGKDENLHEEKDQKGTVTEGFKKNLEEENTKSMNLISSKFTDSNFDSDSKEGQIVMRTSELFNVLSKKGYDVQVTFDNGESQNVIILGQQGGQVNITITNNDQPLRAFASGNFEITDENLKILNDIINEIEVL